MKKPDASLGALSLVFAACTLPAAVHAAPCGGTNINNGTSWNASDVVKGLGGVVHFKFTSVILSSDPGAPFHLASGECAGSALLGADGAITATSGYCARKDKDGDLIFEEWVRTAPGKGSSKVSSGTGKYAKAKWSYEWQHRPLHAPTAAVTWSGDCR